ncbi:MULTISPECIES: ComF family protein [Staphylococcus]|uniref:Competence protein F n=2 Tax=Staphylococcus schleiferi TaxID=1295 RepID=A0A7Z7VXZ4_STASC|nr:MULTISPECIES: ComF family protein [Staphylococcus]EPD53516.1 comF family protein [Staphylococcus sp. HGB0015]CAD7360417.1 competence protein F [Staphylococcus schleiferi]SUM89973.1 competence protein F [Staphylococcus schleiferi]
MRCHYCMKTYDEEVGIRSLFLKPKIVCISCDEAIQACRFNKEGRCPYCLGAYTSGYCRNCDHLNLSTQPFERINAIFHYQGFIKTLFHQYKFLQDVALAEIFAYYIKIPAHDIDFIVPMPSSRENDIKRTFNPVKTILDFQKIAYVDCLKMNVRPKQYTLTPSERFKVQNPIYFEHDESVICLENKSILLIDDIYTTGHTAHCAADVLLQQKVRKLSMLTFAR